MLFISAIRLHRTCPRFWGPNRETCCCPVLRSKPVNLLPPSFVAWIGKPASSDVDVCPASAKFWRLQVFHAPAAWVAYSSLSPPSSLTWPPMTLSGLLRSLGPSLLMFTIHRPCSVGMNLLLDLHRIRWLPHHMVRLYITSQEIHQIYTILSITREGGHRWSLKNIFGSARVGSVYSGVYSGVSTHVHSLFRRLVRLHHHCWEKISTCVGMLLCVASTTHYSTNWRSSFERLSRVISTEIMIHSPTREFKRKWIERFVLESPFSTGIGGARTQ